MHSLSKLKACAAAFLNYWKKKYGSVCKLPVSTTEICVCEKKWICTENIWKTNALIIAIKKAKILDKKAKILDKAKMLIKKPRRQHLLQKQRSWEKNKDWPHGC